VLVHLYPCRQITLVETEFRGSRRRPGSLVLSSYLETLKASFESALPVDVAGLIDWDFKPAKDRAEESVKANAMALLRNAEAEAESVTR